MFLKVTPTFDPNSEYPVIVDPPSNYMPDKKTKQVHQMVQNDFAIADLVRNRSYPEFNWEGFDEALIPYMREMQMRFNSTPPPPSADPDDDWKSNHVQPMTRNKVISIVAAVTNAIMRPKVLAQDKDSSEDQIAARVMEDLMQYVNYKTDYDDKFLSLVQEMCVSPGVIVHQNYTKCMRTIKEINEDGSYTEKMAEDPVLSGFQMDIIPLDEIYISNFYEPDIQKQDFIIWRRPMTYDQACLDAKDREGYQQHVTSGNRLYFSQENDAFFQQADEFLEGRLVYRDIYYNRKKDLQLTFYNGWLDGELDAPYHRADTPIKRKDKKYPFAKTGYEKFNTRSFYYMPLVAKLASVQDEIDVLHRALTDGTLLSIFAPLIATGAEQEETAQIKPGAMNNFTRPDSKVEPMRLGQDLNSAYNLLADQRRQADESSQSPRAAGFSESGEETLGEVQILQQNTQVQLGLIGKMVAKIVRDYGQLVTSSILQHMTVGEVVDIIDGIPELKYSKFIVPDVERMGDRKNSVIEFTTTMPTSFEEELAMSLELAKLERKKNQTIYKVNPTVYREYDYSVIVEPTFEDKTNAFSKRIFAYDRLKQSELIDQESNIKHNLIEPLYPGESSRFIKDETQRQMEAAMAGQAPTARPVGRPPNPPESPQAMPNLPN